LNLILILELSLPTKSTYEIEETTRGITVLEKFDSDHPPTIQNQPPNADILDKVIQSFISYSYRIFIYFSFFNI
jgi:hypothetical protein